MGCEYVMWVVLEISATEGENAIVIIFFLIKNGIIFKKKKKNSVASEHEHLNFEYYIFMSNFFPSQSQIQFLV